MSLVERLFELFHLAAGEYGSAAAKLANGAKPQVNIDIDIDIDSDDDDDDRSAQRVRGNAATKGWHKKGSNYFRLIIKSTHLGVGRRISATR